MEDLPPELIYRISEGSSYKGQKSLKYLNRHYYHHTHTDAYDKIMQAKYNNIRRKLALKLLQTLNDDYFFTIHINPEQHYVLFSPTMYRYMNNVYLLKYIQIRLWIIWINY